MIPRTLLSLLLLFSFQLLSAQTGKAEMAQKAETNQERKKELTSLSSEAAEYLVEASRPADPKRYVEVRGTPFRYDEFGAGYLYDVTLNEYLVDSLNYNGFTGQFEYLLDGQLRELNPNNFLRVEIPLPEGGKHVYGRGINPKFRDKYAEIVYKGEFVTGTMVYDVKNDEKVVQDVGKTLLLRRFSPKSLHFAVVDGDFLTLKMTAKNLAEDLGFKSELMKFIKANKLKPGNREDLIKIYTKADELYQ